MTITENPTQDHTFTVVSDYGDVALETKSFKTAVACFTELNGKRPGRFELYLVDDDGKETKVNI